MEELEFQYLAACAELVTRQQELSVALAESLGVLPNRLLYTWVTHQCEQIGFLPGPEWRHFFHGFECDLMNRDGRYVRCDFGPGGRLDTFTGYGVLQFVMTAKLPWKEFPLLREYLADKSPPYDHLSGSHDRSQALFHRLEKLGHLQAADPELCALLKERTKVQTDGSSLIIHPEGTPWEMQLDFMVAWRPVISASGRKVLSERSS